MLEIVLVPVIKDKTGRIDQVDKRRIALGWAAFGKVANITKSRKASMNVNRKVHNEYVLPVMVYGSETWALRKAHILTSLLTSSRWYAH